MELASFISFLIASICLTLAPGPDILFVLTKSIASGTRAGINVALGLITGTFVHTALAAFGVSLLIRESEIAFSIIKWSGVVYLCYLGISSLRHFNDSPNAETTSEETRIRVRNLYKTGVFMAVLNPKLIIFFLALFPQFIPENASNPSLQMFLLGLTFSGQALVIFVLVALFAGILSGTLRSRPAIAKGMNILSALIFFAIAASVIAV